VSDNSLQTGADSIRDKDRAGVKTQIVGLDLGIGTGTENLMAGTMPVKNASSSTSVLSSVAASVTSVTVLAANASRLGATVFNDSTATLYLAFSASAASTTAYTVQLAAGGYYELPNSGLAYVGAMTGIWSAANGSARVTELT
jgi:hypothetical protein